VVQGIVGCLGGDQEAFRELWLAATEAVSAAGAPSRIEQAFLTRYRRQVEVQHGSLEAPDFERRRRFLVTKLYVEPTIKPLDTNDVSSLLTLSEFDNVINHTVLLGNPGSGKTAACNVIMYRHATRQDQPVPFLVTLRDFANTGTLVRSVIGYIEHQLEIFYQCPPPAGAIESLMADGKALVVFDGLDELLDPVLREDVTSIIELFCADFPRTPVLVTSRVAGYGQAELDPGRFARYQIIEFGEDQVAQYVRNWFAEAGDISSEEASERADEFYRDSSIIPDLRVNPLMLGLMCVVYRGEDFLPRNRVEIYEACVNLLLRKWDARRRIQIHLRAGHLLEPTLRHIAWRLFTRDPVNPFVTEHELLAETSAFVGDRGFEHAADAAEAASDLLEFIRGRAWVFANVGTSSTGELLYAFTNRAFLEYFAAAYLAYASDSPESLARNLMPRIIRQDWEIVAELAVHIKDRIEVRGGERVFRSLLEHAWGPPRLALALDFLARLADSIELPSDLVRKLASQVFDQVNGDLPALTSTRSMTRLLMSKGRTLEVVSDELDIKISGLVSSNNQDDRNAGLRLLLAVPLLGRGAEDTRVHDARKNYWDKWSDERLRRHKDAIAAHLRPDTGIKSNTGLEADVVQTDVGGLLRHPEHTQQIRFEQLSPRQYEEMVLVLLSRVQQAQRVDGSGGDDGRDFYFSDVNGTDAFELKSFTGRLTSAIRQQVERSLNRAMRHSPRSWTLVMPVDPTSTDEQWFNSLRTDFSVPLEWMGKTWLEENLNRYPDIVRYFSGGADEVVRLLSEIADGGTRVQDAELLPTRFGRAVRRLNEIDPYYRFSYSATRDAASVTAHPRYPGAFHDRPIEVNNILRVDDSPGSIVAQETLPEVITFGTRVVIMAGSIDGLVVDTPGGLRGELSGADLILDGAFLPVTEAENTILLRVPPLPPVRYSARLHVEDWSRGPEGLISLRAQDSSGLLGLDLRIDPARQTCEAQLSFRYVSSALPNDAVPVLRICAALANGEQVAFADPGGKVFGIASGRLNSADWPEAYIKCAENLAEVQRLTGAYFPLPEAFSPDDQRDMEYARMILSGGIVDAQWNSMTVRLKIDTVRNLLEQIDSHGQPFAFAAVQEETVFVAGGQLPMGWVQRSVPSAKLSNLREVRKWYEIDGTGTIDVRLEPVGNTDMMICHTAKSPVPSESPSNSTNPD
jgi:hypothetical protein